MGHVIIYNKILGFLSPKNYIIHKCVFVFKIETNDLKLTFEPTYGLRIYFPF